MELVLDILPSVAASCAVALLLCLAMAGGPARAKAVVLATALGYLAGHALAYPPSFPPPEAKATLFCVVAAAALVALCGTPGMAKTSGYRTLRALLAAFGPLYLLWNLVQRWDAREVLRQLVPLQVAWWVIDFLLEARGAKRPTRGALAALGVTLGCAAGVFERSGSLAFAKLALIAACATTACFAVGCWRELPSIAGGGLLVLWSILGALLVGAWHLFAVPKLSIGLLAVAPLAALFPALERIEVSRSRLAWIARAAIAAVLGGAALGLAAAQAADLGPYGS